MARITGLFDFQMKVEGEDADALVEIMSQELNLGRWCNTRAENGRMSARRVCHKTGSNAEDGNAANGAVKAEPNPGAIRAGPDLAGIFLPLSDAGIE